MLAKRIIQKIWIIDYAGLWLLLKMMLLCEMRQLIGFGGGGVGGS
jgi:hypothetical protein